MRELSHEIFANFSSIIVFLHVLSAIIWVGGMIAIRFAIHYSMQTIIEPKLKLERTLENLIRFFNIVIPIIAILLITALIMVFAIDFKGTSLQFAIHIKESIWTIMTLVFIAIYIRRNKAEKAFLEDDMVKTRAYLAPIAQWMIPLNIVLGCIAIYLGIILRGL
ncbi:MAG: hypothetical protein ACNI3C_02625 [Candidatus Marinarcus sp.]|uniref:hypothetical protein n=1 Tax=Candidatus Marinarcus sp. TaxID=3100987 RepID=UPI003B00A4C0